MMFNIQTFTTQDKVSGSDAEKEAAAKKFAEINHGMCVGGDMCIIM